MKFKNAIKASINKANSFQSGNMKKFLENWKKKTSNKYILDTVKHWLKLEFLSKATHSEPFRLTYSTKENGIISQEIGKLLKKKVIVKTVAEKRRFFLLSIFVS